MTDAEWALWLRLRDRRLDGHKFWRQRSFWPYVADFCCLKSKLIIEVDGGQHTPLRDNVRTASLKKQGFRILRFWNNDVLSNIDGVLEVILKALEGERKEEEDPHSNHAALARPPDEPWSGRIPQAGEGV